MATLIIARGLPGSGKTFFARTWVAEDPIGRARVNRDDLRAMLHNSIHIDGPSAPAGGTEPAVAASRDALIRTLLGRGIDVICDDTNLPQRVARHLATIAAQCGASVEVHDLRDVPIELCLARNAKRQGLARVPDGVIRSMYRRYLAGGYVTGVPEVGSVVAAEPYLRRAVDPWASTVYLVDVDGTVALLGGRSPYDTAGVDQDQPNKPVVDVVRTLYDAGHQLVFCSGRHEAARAATAAWLHQHLGIDDPVLYMRADGDMRKDSVVKLEIFDREIRHRYDVLGVFDDRRQVVEMWRSLGLTVFQVAPGDF
ncbi:AAA family ATPase [Actinoplanes sp. TBRC 11911]|uniref:phosphatase domain-containing protein n=1 Tax=Actinoplanes sp. TBRC 11911 TaxID=2729386 RepID=UPI00145D5A42|nr:AAA family ATPase [Actinoplanes sp. TBRC 11911]NMO51999.1 AAA family ATPase [Actinoplanes sp. TBRC 11911]